MVNTSIYHPVGQRIFLIEEYPEEDGVGSSVVHLCDLEDGGSWVEDGDVDLGNDGANNDGFSKGACSRL